MYADYTYYTNQYFGVTVSEMDFPRLATRASDYIDYLTLGKAAGYADNDAVKKCCCALAESFLIVENARVSAASESGELQSETVGEYSRSYRSGAETAAAIQAELKNTASQYLLPLGLLYRGGVACVHSAHCHSL